LPDFVETAATHHQQRAGGDPEEQFRLPERNEIGRPSGCGLDFDKDAAPESNESPGDGIDPDADDVNCGDTTGAPRETAE
jgi:hypothetical protein